MHIKLLAAVRWLVWQPGQELPASFYKEQRNKKGFQLEKHGGEGTLNFSFLWFQSEKKEDCT